MDSSKTVLSAATITGDMTIGNYLGAIKNWVALQKDYRCLYMIADLHALTTHFSEKKELPDLKEKALSFAALYLACGVQPKNLFVQSWVSAHSELCWVLSCMSSMGHLQRMTQFKDKTKNESVIKTGLFLYPVLMVADILLYQTDLVPVGKDQKQHLELARDLAMQFNHQIKPVFKVPTDMIPKQGAKIMSLQEPDKKMSKSDSNPNSFISLLDPIKKAEKKIKSAMTDSGSEILYDEENKPGVSNLITIYSCFKDQSIQESVKDFSELSQYGPFKQRVAEVVCAELEKIQGEYQNYRKDEGALLEILQKNSRQAEQIAQETLSSVKKSS